MTADRSEHLAPRWRGQAGRLEVWYVTWTDCSTGSGGWVHLETVAPTERGPGAAPFRHGWIALFPADGPPRVQRCGPVPVASPAGDAWWSMAEGVGDWARVEPADGDDTDAVRVHGAAGDVRFDLVLTDTAEPLWTFPRPVWERELLPGAQMVPMPTARVVGSVTVDGVRTDVDGPGGLARIYGHGSAQRWGWLHAALDDEGTTLEIVTATARRRALRALPPLALLQLRRPGEADWPRHPLVAAPRFRTHLGASGFRVVGRADGHRIDVEVELPAASTVSLQYVDPDGATATCTNSEVAAARVVLTGRSGSRTWDVTRTAHAEVGHRP